MSIDLGSFCDNPFGLSKFSKDEIFSLDPKLVEQFWFETIALRFSTLREKIPFLSNLAEEHGVESIKSWEDLTPLLMDIDSAFKTYSTEWIEEGRFDLMTRWIDKFTTCDLSGVVVKDCKRIGDWCRLLEKQSPIVVRHSSGTSGNLSLMPRTYQEDERIPIFWMWQLQGFRNERDLSLKKGEDSGATLFYPHARRQFRPMTTIFDYFEKWYTSKPVKTIVDYYSPDLARYAGMKRTLLSKGGDIEQLLAKPLYRELEEELNASDQNFNRNYGAYLEDILTNYQGQRIMMFGFVRMLYDLAQDFKKKGVSNVFRDDSVFFLSGGAGVIGQSEVPETWVEELCDILGVLPDSFKTLYGMSELLEQWPRCPAGNYHFTPLIAPLLIDVETGRLLPREGIQTGRLAFFDLVAETYWGGLACGDEGTLNFAEECSCGRRGVFLYDTVKRVM